jgi:hypothetical protein
MDFPSPTQEPGNCGELPYPQSRPGTDMIFSLILREEMIILRDPSAIASERHDMPDRRVLPQWLLG